MAGSRDTSAEEAMLTEARVEVSYADHKASMVLAALGVGFGALIGGLLAGDWTPSDQGSGEFTWWIGVACAAAAVTCAAAAVWPRYRKAASSEHISFWGDVASIGSLEKLAERLDREPVSSQQRTRSQLWALSRIVAVKYGFIRAAFVMAAAAAAFFTLSALLA